MALKPYLQLLRLPNLFTAAADPLAGWLLAWGSFQHPQRWGLLVGASVAIYAAGLALNDYFDYEVDLVERPKRPLPSGQVTRRFALGLGLGLLVLGLMLAAASGSMASLAVAGVLVLCVLAYDAGLKHSPLGPELMGACRALNLLLGLSQAPGLGGTSCWLLAGMLGFFVTGVTWISRSEAGQARIGPVAAGMIFENLAILGMMGGVLGKSGFVHSNEPRAIVPVEGLLVLAIVWLVVNLATGKALRELTSPAVQRAVKTGVFSLIWLDVGVVAAVRGPLPALVIAALWVPAFLLGRWLYAT